MSYHPALAGGSSPGLLSLHLNMKFCLGLSHRVICIDPIAYPQCPPCECQDNCMDPEVAVLAWPLHHCNIVALAIQLPAFDLLILDLSLQFITILYTFHVYCCHLFIILLMLRYFTVYVLILYTLRCVCYTNAMQA